MPREVVKTPSLEIFKLGLDEQSVVVEDVPAHCREVGLDDL